MLNPLVLGGILGKRRRRRLQLFESFSFVSSFWCLQCASLHCLSAISTIWSPKPLRLFLKMDTSLPHSADKLICVMLLPISSVLGEYRFLFVWQKSIFYWMLDSKSTGSESNLAETAAHQTDGHILSVQRLRLD